MRQALASNWWLSPALLVIVTLSIFSLLGQIPQPASPKEIYSLPTPNPATSLVPLASQPVIVTNPVLDLFSPNAATLAHDQSRAKVQNTIEQLLISARIINHCGMITAQQYQQLIAAGWHYAASAKLADTSEKLMPQFQQLQIKAQQSYDLVYKRPESCYDPTLPALRAALLAWQEKIMSVSTLRLNSTQ